MHILHWVVVLVDNEDSVTHYMANLFPAPPSQKLLIKVFFIGLREFRSSETKMKNFIGLHVTLLKRTL